MPADTQPMSVAELLELLKYSGQSAVCTIEPPVAKRMYATVTYLETALRDERANRERLQEQLTAAQRDFEALDERYSRLTSWRSEEAGK